MTMHNKVRLHNAQLTLNVSKLGITVMTTVGHTSANRSVAKWVR